MKRVTMGILALGLALTGCDDDVFVVGGSPAAPRSLDASYYAGVVTVTWELAPDWNGEAFRVYSRRLTDADYFFIAEVTNCADGFCSYEDINVVGGETYEYYVSAVDFDSGIETASDYSVEVPVPVVSAPLAPGSVRVIALDNANYVAWDADSRSASDFSHYRVWQFTDEGDEFLLGETDSEGFLDLLAGNGLTYSYFVTAVDTDGHESESSLVASGTPRPDFSGEWLYDHFDQPTLSGFRFQESEDVNPILSGTSVDRHFRLETDQAGWWIVPGSGTTIYPTGFATTALKCGVGADAGCSDVSSAPLAGYVAQDVAVESQTTYVIQVIGDDGQLHFGAIRIEMLGFDQDDNALMIFDWAYQIQAGNPDLVNGR